MAKAQHAASSVDAELAAADQEYARLNGEGRRARGPASRSLAHWASRRPMGRQHRRMLFKLLGEMLCRGCEGPQEPPAACPSQQHPCSPSRSFCQGRPR